MYEFTLRAASRSGLVASTTTGPLSGAKGREDELRSLQEDKRSAAIAKRIAARNPGIVVTSSLRENDAGNKAEGSGAWAPARESGGTRRGARRGSTQDEDLNLAQLLRVLRSAGSQNCTNSRGRSFCPEPFFVRLTANLLERPRPADRPPRAAPPWRGGESWDADELNPCSVR